MYENKREQFSPSPRLKILIRNAVILLGWTGLMAGGFGALIKYESAPARSGNAPAQNAIARESSKMSLVIAIHPKCPCTRATIGELHKIHSHAPGKFEIVAFVFKPESEPDSWIETASVEDLKKISPRIVVDVNGAEAKKLGLTTSGQVLLYNPEGDLVYNGGITKARGHSGDNLGEETLLNLIQGEAAAGWSAPVFGCSMTETNE